MTSLHHLPHVCRFTLEEQTPCIYVGIGVFVRIQYIVSFLCWRWHEARYSSHPNPKFHIPVFSVLYGSSRWLYKLNELDIEVESWSIDWLVTWLERFVAVSVFVIFCRIRSLKFRKEDRSDETIDDAIVCAAIVSGLAEFGGWDSIKDNGLLLSAVPSGGVLSARISSPSVSSSHL